MKVAPIVTVLLPVYNGAAYLEEAIKSIQKQSYKNWELLIINDGSKDQTITICHKFTQKDPRIKLIDNKKHLGLIKSLNLGLKLAKGEYVARQDADDFSLPNRIMRQVDFLKKNKEYGLICSTFMVKTEDGKIIKITALPTDDYEIKLSMLFFNPITHGAVMLRKNVLEKNNLQYEGENLHCEDYGLWVKMIPHTKFKIIAEPLYQWTVAKDGITAKNLDVMKKRMTSLSESINIKIDFKKIKQLNKKYKKITWKYQKNLFVIDYKKMYQKLLFNLAKLFFSQHEYKKSWQLLAYSFSVSPQNYFKKIFSQFKKNKLDELQLRDLIKKIN